MHAHITDNNNIEFCESLRTKDTKMLLATPDKFDIIVSDKEMPLMNGYELVSNIKSDPKLAQIPVLVLTSSYFKEQNT